MSTHIFQLCCWIAFIVYRLLTCLTSPCLNCVYSHQSTNPLICICLSDTCMSSSFSPCSDFFTLIYIYIWYLYNIPFMFRGWFRLLIDPCGLHRLIGPHHPPLADVLFVFIILLKLHHGELHATAWLENIAHISYLSKRAFFDPCDESKLRRKPCFKRIPDSNLSAPYTFYAVWYIIFAYLTFWFDLISTVVLLDNTAFLKPAPEEGI